MTITFSVDDVTVKKVSQIETNDNTSPFIRTEKFKQMEVGGNMIQKTENDQNGKIGFKSYENGFIFTLLGAYNQHHKLVIRPDDVWIAIVVQFGLYVNGNAEELRDHFVAHKGKKELSVRAEGTIGTVNFERILAKLFVKELHDNVTDPELCSWVVPDFTTTTTNDKVVGSIALMASMQKYFDYVCYLECGLPEITLLGTTEDWESIHHRVAKLALYGDKCKKWSELLSIIISNFVETSKNNIPKEFWKTMCHRYAGGSGPSLMSGWLTTFCVWSANGKWQGDKRTDSYRGIKDNGFPIVELGSVPSGFLTVPLLIDDNGTEIKSVIFAGHGDATVTNEDTLQPRVSWAIFEDTK